MKISIASDLHLEFGELDLQNTDGADVLVLAGDILVAQDLYDHPEPEVPHSTDMEKILGRRFTKAQQYRTFIRTVSQNFPHVVIVAGNHEFYHGRWKSSLDVLRESWGKYPNCHFLERDTWYHGDVLFVGGTLWTDMNGDDPSTQFHLSSMMNDFRIIKNDELGFTRLRPQHALDRHRNTLGYFDLVTRDHNKVVVVSHHAPHPNSIHPHHRYDVLMNGGYHSNLDNWIVSRPQIVLWCHGHMHHHNDYLVGNTRVVSNPRGYVGYDDTNNFDLFTVEV